jgi:hypothetical protein
VFLAHRSVSSERSNQDAVMQFGELEVAPKGKRSCMKQGNRASEATTSPAAPRIHPSIHRRVCIVSSPSSLHWRLPTTP